MDRASLQDSYLGVGSPAHHPDLLLKIVLYEILDGHLSPAQWARHIRDSDALRWLGQGIQPSRSALYTFRDRLSDPVFEMHAQAIRAAVEEGLTTAEFAVQDGTSFRACASRHQVANEEKIAKRIDELSAAVAKDAASEQLESPPYWMAGTPSGRRKQLDQYKTARINIADRLVKNQARPKDKQLPRSKVKVSVTEPEAPLGRDKEKVFCPMYTAQCLVDPSSLLILSFGVFAQATDAGTLPTMLDRTREVTGVMVTQISTDSGYASLLDLQECESRGVQLVAPVQENDFTEGKRAKKAKSQEGKRAKQAKPQFGKDKFEWLPEKETYRCPQGHLLDHKGQETKHRRDDQTVIQHRYQCAAEHCRVCPLKESCTQSPERGRTVKRLEGEELMETHKTFMKTPEAKAVRRVRGSVIERCFGDAKEHRKLRRLHGRGLKRAKAEIGAVVLAQTALTLVRLRKRTANPGENRG